MTFDKTDHAHISSEDECGSSDHIATAARQLKEGEMIGNYRIVSLIGQGAMGSVYVVDQVMLKKRFALKTLNPIAATDIVLRRFQNEAQTMGRLDHPNIVSSSDFGLIDNTQPFLVMDYVEGQTLSQILKEKGHLSVELALQIFIPICFAIGYAHQEGVVHRDIKPGNIMLAKSDSIATDFIPKIVDFGIAKLASAEEDRQALTRTGEVFGTPLYMSPEQCSGAKIDKRSDIYSLGCVMYEALTGSPPFVAPTALETMMQHSTAQLPSMKDASLGCEIPAALENIIAKMLAKDPRDRYQSCLETAEDLIRFQTNPLAASVKKIEDKNRNQSKSNLSKVWWCAAIACTIFGALGYGWYAHNNSPDLNNGKAGSEQAPTQGKPEPHPEPHPEPQQEQQSNQTDQEVVKFVPPGGSFVYEDATSSDRNHFHFPPTASLGTIFYWNTPVKIVSIEAKGTVASPAAKAIFLPGGNLMLNPALAQYFTDDDFWGFVDDFPVLSDQGSLDKINEPLTRLYSLRIACFRKSPLNEGSYTHLGSLHQLTWLFGRKSFQAEQIAKFSRLREFTVLGIEQTRKVTTVLKKLYGSTKLKRLSLDDTDICAADINLIAKCRSLTHLNLLHDFEHPDYLRLTDKERQECMAQLATLPDLRCLAVGYLLGTKNHVTPEVLAHLSAMKKLEVLYLQAPVTEDLRKQIQSYLNPNCRISTWRETQPIPDDPQGWFDPRHTNPDVDKLW